MSEKITLKDPYLSSSSLNINVTRNDSNLPLKETKYILKNFTYLSNEFSDDKTLNIIKLLEETNSFKRYKMAGLFSSVPKKILDKKGGVNQKKKKEFHLFLLKYIIKRIHFRLKVNSPYNDYQYCVIYQNYEELFNIKNETYWNELKEFLLFFEESFKEINHWNFPNFLFIIKNEQINQDFKLDINLGRRQFKKVVEYRNNRRTERIEKSDWQMMKLTTMSSKIEEISNNCEILETIYRDRLKTY